MFKNKAFKVKMIDDDETPPLRMTYYIPSDEIERIVKQTVFTVALGVGGVLVAKNLSFALGSTMRDVTWRIVDAKVPYPPINR